ncbi:hypothetical protein [Roseobacter sp.]|uniref:hypothetical protein n=1 Tax=Roseobacter sp. TaxID=1907202 RepID=UPI00385D5A5E
MFMRFCLLASLAGTAVPALAITEADCGNTPSVSIVVGTYSSICAEIVEGSAILAITQAERQGTQVNISHRVNFPDMTWTRFAAGTAPKFSTVYAVASTEKLDVKDDMVLYASALCEELQ